MCHRRVRQVLDHRVSHRLIQHHSTGQRACISLLPKASPLFCTAAGAVLASHAPAPATERRCIMKPCPCFPSDYPSQFGDALLTLLEKFLERDAGVPAALLCCVCNACKQQGVGVALGARRWRRLWGCGASAPLCPGCGTMGWCLRLLCVRAWRLLCVRACRSLPSS